MDEIHLNLVFRRWLYKISIKIFKAVYLGVISRLKFQDTTNTTLSQPKHTCILCYILENVGTDCSKMLITGIVNNSKMKKYIFNRQLC